MANIFTKEGWVNHERNTIGILCINCTYSVLKLFVNVFFVAQVYELTGRNLTAVGLFVLFELSVMYVFYAVSSFLCKKTKPMYLIRIATILCCVLLVFAVFLQDHIATLYMLLAAFWGMSAGLYHGAKNYLTTACFKKNESLHTYMAWKEGATMFIAIIFPFTFGLLIDLGSFYITTIIALVIGFLQVLASFYVRPPGQLSERGSLQFRKYFEALKESGHKKAAWQLFAITALSAHVLSVAIIALIVTVLDAGFGLGFVTTGASIFAILVVIGYKQSRGKLKTAIYLCVAFVPLIAAGMFFVTVSLATVVVFQVLWASRQVITLEEVTSRLGATKVWGGERFVVESNLFYETGLLCGRMVSVGLIILVGALGATQVMLAALTIFTLCCVALHAVLSVLWRGKHAGVKRPEIEE
jgi:MFS family permease